MVIHACERLRRVGWLLVFSLHRLSHPLLGQIRPTSQDHPSFTFRAQQLLKVAISHRALPSPSSCASRTAQNPPTVLWSIRVARSLTR